MSASPICRRVHTGRGLAERTADGATCNVRQIGTPCDDGEQPLRRRIPQLREPAPGRFNEHYAILAREILALVDYLVAEEARLSIRVDELMPPFSAARDLLVTIPGVQRLTTEIVIAEIGVDMSWFPTAQHLASWVGMCPRNNMFAGKHRSGRTRKGDPWLLSALVEAPGQRLGASGRRCKPGSGRSRNAAGPNKRSFAIAHYLLVAMWWVLHDNVAFSEMGDSCLYRRLNPARRQHQLVHQLEQMGLSVTLEPAA